MYAKRSPSGEKAGLWSVRVERATPSGAPSCHSGWREPRTGTKVEVGIGPGIDERHLLTLPRDGGEGGVPQGGGERPWRAAGNRNPPDSALRPVAWARKHNFPAVGTPRDAVDVLAIKCKPPGPATRRGNYEDFPSSASAGKHTDECEPFPIRVIWWGAETDFAKIPAFRHARIRSTIARHKKNRHLLRLQTAVSTKSGAPYESSGREYFAGSRFIK